MDNGQTTLSTLLRSLRKDRLVVRAAIERTPKPAIRMMVVDALPEPARVGREVSDYGRAQLALRTANRPESGAFVYSALGLAGEAGEYADHVKKAFFQGHER